MIRAVWCFNSSAKDFFACSKLDDLNREKTLDMGKIKNQTRIYETCGLGAFEFGVVKCAMTPI